MQSHYTPVQRDLSEHSKAFPTAAQFVSAVLLSAGFMRELKASLHFSKVEIQH